MLFCFRMASMAPSRTSGGVGRSQMPCPRLMPPTRSHSRVMRRMSLCTRPSRRLAIFMSVTLLHDDEARPQVVHQRPQLLGAHLVAVAGHGRAVEAHGDGAVQVEGRVAAAIDL